LASRASDDLESVFPQLAADNYRLASPADGKYNCIAYAANDTSIFWWPTKKPTGGYYWPPDAPREVTLKAFRIAFETLGYEVCQDGSLEPALEKIAIYVNNDGVPTHAARQLSSGSWVSKLGFDVDIEHTHPDAVGGDEGDGYGSIALYMARASQDL
jgi:hypothetical protein